MDRRTAMEKMRAKKIPRLQRSSRFLCSYCLRLVRADLTRCDGFWNQQDGVNGRRLLNTRDIPTLAGGSPPLTYVTYNPSSSARFAIGVRDRGLDIFMFTPHLLGALCGKASSELTTEGTESTEPHGRDRIEFSGNAVWISQRFTVRLMVRFRLSNELCPTELAVPTQGQMSESFPEICGKVVPS